MYDFFTGLGYTLIFKEMNTNPKIPNKGNVDAELVLHTMIEYPHYKQAVIITGDGDFACLIKYLKQKTKLKALIVPNKKRYASSLNEASGGEIDSLTDMKNILQYVSSEKQELDESFDDRFYS